MLRALERDLVDFEPHDAVPPEIASFYKVVPKRPRWNIVFNTTKILSKMLCEDVAMHIFEFVLELFAEGMASMHVTQLKYWNKRYAKNAEVIRQGLVHPWELGMTIEVFMVDTPMEVKTFEYKFDEGLYLRHGPVAKTLTTKYMERATRKYLNEWYGQRDMLMRFKFDCDYVAHVY